MSPGPRGALIGSLHGTSGRINLGGAVLGDRAWGAPTRTVADSRQHLSEGPSARQTGVMTKTEVEQRLPEGLQRVVSLLDDLSSTSSGVSLSDEEAMEIASAEIRKMRQERGAYRSASSPIPTLSSAPQPSPDGVSAEVAQS
ncbi:MAG TPA: hypothetical protein VE569_06680, partial [Acidimicrobiia bacterium]|nr:hypothetical protein [Acidimicrobiia bacterium]